jgi:hypothetical protein
VLRTRWFSAEKRGKAGVTLKRKDLHEGRYNWKYLFIHRYERETISEESAAK